MSSKFNHVRTIINSARFFDMSDLEKHQTLKQIENAGVTRDDLMAILSDSGWGILHNGQFMNTSRGIPRTLQVGNLNTPAPRSEDVFSNVPQQPNQLPIPRQQFLSVLPPPGSVHSNEPLALLLSSRPGVPVPGMYPLNSQQVNQPINP